MTNIKSFFRTAVAWLQNYLGKFVKVKKVKKGPRVRQVSQKTANLAFYIGLGLLLFIGFISMLRSITLAGKVTSLKNQVAQFDKQVADFTSEQVGLDLMKVEQYMDDFMEVFINFEPEQADERLEKLKEYYSFDLTSFDEAVESKRTLVGRRLIGVTAGKDYKLARFRVDYEQGEGDKTEKTEVYAIPFEVTKSGQLAIVSPPYVVAEEDLTGQAESFERKDMSTVERLDEETTESVKKFLAYFFDKYALADKKDLKVLMAKPELMADGYQVAAINDSSAVFFQEGEKTVVQVSVKFEEIETKAAHTEYFTLYLTKQKNSWFVNELYHYFK